MQTRRNGYIDQRKESIQRGQEVLIALSEVGESGDGVTMATVSEDLMENERYQELR